MSDAPDDPAARRLDLAAKRDALFAQQAERAAQQRHAEEAAEFHRYHGAALEAAGVRHALHWNTEAARGPLTTYPIGFASIRWDFVPHAVRQQGESPARLKELLEEALRALDVAPTTTVIVDWCVSRRPRVALSAADACAHAIALMACASDTWVYAQGATWVVEIHHDGWVTYADRPGLPEHAGDGWRDERTGR
ncbi:MULTISPECIES: hypothetical protein [Lysobacteraceae]|nr:MULTISPECIES: hypothetical protein [Lysobacter]